MLTLLGTFAPLLAADAATAGGRPIPDWAKGNSIFEAFFKGGPVMYPIAAVLIVAVAVVLERIVWWTIQTARREPNKLDKVYAALEQGNVAGAINLARGSTDPLVRTVWHGLSHVHASVEGALQVASGVELQRAGRFMSVMDTTITLAPLLGLLGTVTGIMGSFNFVGNADLAPTKVSGGIAEALIATACGLGIAIFALIFFNFFNARVARLQFELESTSNNVILMLNSLRNRNNVVSNQDAHQQPPQFAGTN
ncbi:MAG: MotA/TolQ/ExbB proton channel family protein [Verrucomicrobia bacterium]|nr:MotA/TolQ/ExbB proton channel family protein [Verrucomicrobiota bacterium]MBV9129885.1 MotA/TolQ/ExbB proton channel family protein [Verrucomicrobiota bacterium]MBV9642145.1 MotA/TolQ/ExbB proton channel family protein [Verrucomicrobiota bacterium]